jgi:hypothetical protein
VIETLGLWAPLLLSALALIAALAAMTEVKSTKRSQLARDLAVEKLQESVARLQASDATKSIVARTAPDTSASEHEMDRERPREPARVGEPVTAPDGEVTASPSKAAPTLAEPLVDAAAWSEPLVERHPEYSPELVRTLYRNWCRDRTRPKSTSNMEIASLQYDGRAEGAEGRSKHRLKDASQLAEFVRFSGKGASNGLVLPDPDAHFTPVVAYLFPGITRADYSQSERLGEQEPVPIKRCSPSQWEAM